MDGRIDDILYYTDLFRCLDVFVQISIDCSSRNKSVDNRMGHIMGLDQSILLCMCIHVCIYLFIFYFLKIYMYVM